MMWFGEKVKSRYGSKSGWWVDAASLAVACLWGGLVLLLWPYGATENRGSSMRYKSMLVAGERNLADCAVYRLPTIIALPSFLSFEPQEETDYEDIKFADNHAEYVNMLKRSDCGLRSVPAADSVELAAEAVRDISSVDGLISMNAGEAQFRPKRLRPDIFVAVSGSVGDDVSPVWSKSDRGELFGGATVWEAEVSFGIGADGIPEDVFLEKSSGQNVIDRAVVRILSRPDVWKNAVPGCGSVLISFAPVVLNGAVHED